MKSWNKLCFYTDSVMLMLGRVALVTIAWTWMSYTTAQPSSPFAGGDGTEASPYQIMTPAQLDSIREDGGDNYLEDHFVLMNDLDFDGYLYANMTRGWLPIGHDTNNGNTSFNGTRFTGSFDGNGHVIRNLFIHREASGGTPRDYIGLFGALGGSAKIDSLGVESVRITGRNNVGGLVGVIGGSSTVSHSYVTGRIEGSGNFVGGIASRIGNANGTIEESYAAVQVFGVNDVGGLIGENKGNVSNNYALGEVEGNERVGGLIGKNTQTVSACYAAASVEGTMNTGGLVGSNSSGTYTNNYWNTDVSGQTASAIDADGEVKGLTTMEMYVQGNFTGFDFTGSGAWQEPNTDETRFPRLRNVQRNGQLLIFSKIPLKFKTIPEDNSFTLDYELLPTTLSGADPSFESSDERVATIDASGEVTLTGVGVAMLTVSRDGTDNYASISASLEAVVLPFDGGAGTTANPYKISTPAQLDFIRKHGDDDLNLLDDHYVLTSHLDFSEYGYASEEGWQPIGHDTDNGTIGFQGTAFTGSFNGKGLAIRHLRINRLTQDYVGLFGRISGVTVDSLAVEEADIKGRLYVGSLAGEMESDAKFTRSYASGQIQGNDNVGGLVGRVNGGMVEESHASLRVSGDDIVGGLVGFLNTDDTVTNSYATGWTDGNINVGGLVGENHEGEVINSYAAVLVEGNTKVGALIGSNDDGDYIRNYWNREISGGQSLGTGGTRDPDGITVLTLEQMHNPSIFSTANWDVYAASSNPHGVWDPPTANQFPQLRGVTKNAQVIHFPPITPRKETSSGTLTLTYTLVPTTDPSGTSVSFESSDETVATVNNNGEVTLQGVVGSTTLTISRAGNDDYVPLISVSRRLIVHPFEGGTGTTDDPYLIATPAQLDSIRDYSRGGTIDGKENYLDDHFVLMNDLEFSGYTYADIEKGWQPIGHDTDNSSGFQGTPFTGSFNGRGFAIRHVRINRPEQDYVGLFGAIGNVAKIDSLGVEDIQVIGNENVGGLMGLAVRGTISNSYVVGRVQGTNRAGGLGGHTQISTIETSYAAVQVEGSRVAGGLLGRNTSTVENSYATGPVTGVSNIGGLVGENVGGTINTSYAVGRVQGTSDVGGLIGKIEASTTHDANYWNPDISGQTTSAGHVATEIDSLSTKRMYVPTNFSGWDFYNAMDNADGVWDPPTDGEHFPLLRGVAKNAQVLDFLPVPLKALGDAPFTVDYALWPATFAERDTVFTSSHEEVANISTSGEVTINTTGITTLTISRTGNDDYAPVSVSRVLVVHPFERGTGTETDPYEVATPAQLDFIRDHGGNDLNFLNDHYELTQDLDFIDYVYEDPDEGWQPIGHDVGYGGDTYEGAPFTGSFNGRGHVIRHLKINRPGQDYVGLFGYMNSDFKIDSIGVEEINITGDQYVGGLVSAMENGNIINSYAVGNVEGEGMVGGLIGILEGTSSGMIDNSYATGQVTARSSIAGGLIGRMDARAYLLRYSYAASQVTGSENVGGLIGNSGVVDSIYDCYAVGQIAGNDKVGGLIGNAFSVDFTGNNYAAVRVEGKTNVGGLIGYEDNSGTYTANYWNMDISQQVSAIGNKADPAGIAALSTEDMYDQTNFTEWNFDDVWNTPTDMEHFPQLQAVTRNGQLLVIPQEPLVTLGSEPFTLTYTLLPPTLPGANTVFESSDATVATIDDNGKVTINKTGEEVMLTISRAGNDHYAPINARQRLFAHPFTEGDGTETNPYQVTTPTQLDFIRDHGGNDLNFLDDHYVLTEDLNFDNHTYSDATLGWLPIAHDTASSNTAHDGTPFTGSFNGQGHTIRNLLIDREEDYVGLFGRIDGSATIDSLGMEELDITGRNHVGSLAGEVDGGLSKIATTGQVEGNDHVGGLAGSTSSNGSIQHAYAVVSVSGNEAVGGLLGLNSGAIDTCYAAGAVTGTTSIGGLVGSNNGTVMASYWNTETSGQATSNGGESLNTNEMYAEASFVDWNFTDVWISPMQDVYFPFLRGVGSWQSVSIAADMPSITEADEEATFTLTRKGALIGALSLELSITEQGAFLNGSTPSSAMFAAGANTASLTLDIDDDDIDEADGNVTVTLKENMGYALIADAKESTVSITDDDLPKVSMAAEATTVTEGEDVVFTLTREGQTTTALSVVVDVTQQGTYANPNDVGSRTIDFAEGSAIAMLTVATGDDTEDMQGGAITATVQQSTDYTVDDPASIEVDITDNDKDGTATPGVSIAAVSNSVTEGADAIFTLTRTVTSGILTVNIEVIPQGDYINGTPPSTIDFADGEATATLTVATLDDNIDEPNGIITATVRQGIGYTVGDPSTAEVGITDNDGETDATVRITPASSSVTEGADAIFTLTRTVPSGILTVNIEVIPQGDYINGTPPSTIDFADGEATATLTVATLDDNIDEPNGIITATVRPGIGYTVGDPSTAEVGITDNDGETDATVRITPASSSVTEGADAIFTLTRTVTQGILTVNIEVIPQGDYINGTPPSTIDFADGEATATLTVATLDDDIDEPNGIITATVKQGNGYTVGDPSAAEVEVTDNDGPMTVGLSEKAEVILYPNPVRRQLHVRLPQGGQMSIYTLSGRRERNYRIPRQEPVSIDVSGLSPGIYVVTLTDDNGISTHYRVIKE